MEERERLRKYLMVTLTLGDELDEGVEENQDLRMTHRC